MSEHDLLINDVHACTHVYRATLSRTDFTLMFALKFNLYFNNGIRNCNQMVYKTYL